MKIKDFLHFNHGLFFKRRKEFSQLTKGQSFRADVRVGLAPAKKKKKKRKKRALLTSEKDVGPIKSGLRRSKK